MVVDFRILVGLLVGISYVSWNRLFSRVRCTVTRHQHADAARRGGPSSLVSRRVVSVASVSVTAIQLLDYRLHSPQINQIVPRNWSMPDGRRRLRNRNEQRRVGRRRRRGCIVIRRKGCDAMRCSEKGPNAICAPIAGYRECLKHRARRWSPAIGTGR